MKIEEAVEYMSSLYLERVLTSYTNDYERRGEEDYRKYIIDGAKILSSAENIKTRLDSYFAGNKDSYSKKILYKLVLISLLSKQHYFSNENGIVSEVLEKEEEIIKQSESQDSFKHLDENSITIMTAILEVALEDGSISSEELALIRKLRKKLSINEKDQFLLQAKINQFPSEGNTKHNRSEIIDVINDLQKCGVVFCCNKHDEIKETIFVIPEEIVPGLKKSLEIELIDSKYLLLLNKLQASQLKDVLSTSNLAQYGNKEELAKRILQAGIHPSEVLIELSSTELSKLCDKLPGANRTGTKDEKVDRIIDYFSSLVFKEEPKSENQGEIYFNYLEELAARDESSLRTNEIINRAKEINSAFEVGTKYLFEEKFNHHIIQFEGNEHADGGVKFDGSKNLLLWDNKAKDDGKPYKFPDSHFRQFRRYIRNENAKGFRVSCFLIVTAEIDSASLTNAVKLKAESGADTDVALISAENLKMLSEEWQDYTKDKKFNLHILNHTGILDRDTLKIRMKTLS
ncbi:hypothetical protein [Gracilimonas sp.]|uniref:hypothetical protein n=1 Tax=Gracilimonas sp. TaxID=1974203 RepID=UPI003BABD4D8